MVGLIVGLVFAAALYVWNSLAHAALFRKLGEPGWQAWVPVYNVFVTFRLGGVNMWWALALFFPIIAVVGIVFRIIALHRISQRFGKGVGFTVLGVLVEPVWASIIGWGSSTAVDGTVALDALQPAAAGPAAGPATWPATATSGTGVGLSAGVGAVLPVPAQVPGRVPVAGQAAFIETPPPASPVVSAPPLASATPPPAPPAFEANASADAEQPGPVSTAAPAAAFSYTPPVITPPAWSAPAAPIEMPEEISVRVSPVHTPTVRPAQPLIDVVPGFGTPPAAAPQNPGTPFAAASTGVAPQTGTTGVVQPAASGQNQPAAADDFDDDMDATIIAGRRNKAWVFETDAGQRVPLTAQVVLLGRNPSAAEDYPNAQLVTVRDAGRTISKTHARIEFVDSEWIITDLHSTNGVYLVDDGGEETELESGMAASVGSRFVLGEVAVRIFQED